MKIVVVSQSYYPRPGGVTEHVHHTSQELARRGHEVTIVTANFGGAYGTGFDVPGDVVRIGRNMLVPINGAWVNMTVGIDLHAQLRDVLRSLSPDVVHTHCPLVPTLPLIALAAAPPSARIIGTFHAAARTSLGYRLFQRELGRRAARLDGRIAVSRAALELAEKHFPGDYAVVPNGVDVERFHTGNAPIERWRDGAFNILFVGRLDRRKGIKYLFRAVNLLADSIDRRVRLIAVGESGLRRHMLPRLDRRIEAVFTGVVDRAALPRYFTTADVFCSPATERESFGIVLLEAMASGTPIVATAIPGYLTILRDGWNALAVPPRSPAALAEAIRRIAHDPVLAGRLAANGLRFAQRYRWDRVVDRLTAIYTGAPRRTPLKTATPAPAFEEAR